MNDPMKIKIFRTLTGKELDDVAQLFVVVDASYEGEYWWYEVRQQGLPAAKKLLTRNWHTVAVASQYSKIIAFTGLDEPDTNSVELIRVMTHPNHTGKGAATKCTKALLDKADHEGLAVWLNVLANATGAIKLYKKLGFVQFDNKPVEHSLRPAIQMRRNHPIT